MIVASPRPFSHARRQSGGGFTLIELLTVIAIIAILAGILIPVVGSVRESARAAVCQSRLRQLHSAAMLYANDHQDLFPQDGTDQGTWSQRISSYLDIADIIASNGSEFFQCPSRTEDTVGWYWWQSHYGINYLLSGPWYSSWLYGEGKKVGHIELPSQVMLFQDNSHRNRAAMPWATQPRPERVREMFVHNGRTNLVFVDGHVEAMNEQSYPLNHQRSATLEEAPRPFGYRSH
jgi:prepilin-type N-terminal cleavage/methylation domain-containing protein/prepilin-type processing-associated H-X9-DG protein